MHHPGIVVRKGFEHKLRPLKSYKVIAFDMDSTLINIECIDELADLAGCKTEVSAITEAAMRGKIADFKESLRQRVALLTGTSVSRLDEVYRTRLRLNSGASELIKSCKEVGMYVILVSSGFTFFAERVRDLLGIDQVRANELDIAEGRLTGRLVPQPWGDICDGEEKKKVLLQVCERLQVDLRDTIAVGDGANDLPMMSVSGLSCAYHAKPKVREQAMVSINEGGLDRLLEVLPGAKEPA